MQSISAGIKQTLNLFPNIKHNFKFKLKNKIDTPTWVQFFKDASVPSQYVNTYALKFSENRIRFDMLGDLDRPLLAEMGITAIGDCLSILKHAKAINARIEERRKEFTTTSLTPSLAESQQALKKRTEVAKRIIETYLCDPDAKPLNEKSAQSSLSADLISRLNFTNLGPSPAPASKQTVTFNEDSLNQASKVTVSSTTSDDEFVSAKTPKLLNLKRKLDDVEEITDAEDSNGPPLEYKGVLLSPSKSNLVSLNIRAQSLNEPVKLTNKPVKSRLGTAVSSRLSKGEDSLMSSKISTNLESIRLGATTKDNEEKVSVFKRIRAATAPAVELTGIKKNIVNEQTSKPKIIPITFDAKPAITTVTRVKMTNQPLAKPAESKIISLNANKSQSLVKKTGLEMDSRLKNKSVHDRLKF
jgi:hypothetical protein